MRTCSGLARLFALCLGVLGLACVNASANDYPNKPIRFIVCFAAGGPNDITARLFSQFLSEHFNQQFVVENRPGAGGNIGMQAALTSPPDGYTIVFVGPNNFINPSIYAHMPFDFIRDSAPVAGTMKMTNILVVNPEFHLKTLHEYVAYAKANPGKLNFGSGGVGTSPHMSGELLKSMTGIDIVHVPYRGTAPALVDVLGGQLHSAFDNLPGRSDTSSPASCARSASPTPSASISFRTCRPSPKACRATRRTSFTGSRCRRGHRPTSSPSSMPRSTRC